MATSLTMAISVSGAWELKPHSAGYEPAWIMGGEGYCCISNNLIVADTPQESKNFTKLHPVWFPDSHILAGATQICVWSDLSMAPKRQSGYIFCCLAAAKALVLIKAHPLQCWGSCCLAMFLLMVAHRALEMANVNTGSPVKGDNSRDQHGCDGLRGWWPIRVLQRSRSAHLMLLTMKYIRSVHPWTRG